MNAYNVGTFFPVTARAAIPSFSQYGDGEIRTDSIDLISSTGEPTEMADEYVEATYSWKTKGYFQVFLALFLACLGSFGFGIALSDPRLVAGGAVIMSFASAMLFVCIRRANREHERSN